MSARPDHHVYRCWGDEEETDLLYVGRTGRGDVVRFQEHAREEEWWPEVDHYTIAEARLHAVGHADRIETRAIQTEHPRYNVVHNRKR